MNSYYIRPNNIFYNNQLVSEVNKEFKKSLLDALNETIQRSYYRNDFKQFFYDLTSAGKVVVDIRGW